MGQGGQLGRSVCRTDNACPTYGVGRPRFEQMSSRLVRTTFGFVGTESQQWIVPDRCQKDDTVPLCVCIALRLCSDRGREADVEGPRRFSPGWGFGRESSDISAGSGRPAHYWGISPLGVGYCEQ